MKRILASFFPCLLILFLISGCGSSTTYPKERLAQSVEELCRNEYHTEVFAKVVGQTLGVYLVLDTLIDTSSGQLSFEDQASEILEDVMTSIRRVTLSTDADVKFFTLIGVDESLGIELEMTRYIEDIRRVMLTNISRNDFFGRMMYKLRPSPSVLGRKRIFHFFNSLGKQSIEKIMQENFAEDITIKDISSPFFLNLLETGMKENAKTKIIELKEMPFTKNDILYYVKTVETFKIKEGFTEESLFYPPGFENEYLIHISTKNYAALIQKIYPLVTINKDKARVALPFPDEFEAYQDLNQWKENDFYVEEAQLPDFIAFQVAQQIRSLIHSIEDVEANFIEETSENMPEGLPKRSIFELIFTMKKSQEEKKLTRPLVQASVTALEKICKNYNFTGFSGIRITDSEKTEILNIDRAMMKTLFTK